MDIKAKKMTTIVYESPYRIEKLLKDMNEVMPEFKVCIAREMTKKFEEFLFGTAGELLDKLKEKKLKGEITVVIGNDN